MRVRDRHWVVTNVVESTLTNAAAALSLLVELSSVEDDAYADELSVFWEVEPGIVILPKATLPNPKDRKCGAGSAQIDWADRSAFRSVFPLAHSPDTGAGSQEDDE